MQIRTRKGKDSKIPLLSFLIVVVAALSIGFSAVSTTLKINGTAKVTGMSWKIEFQNLSEATLTGSAEKISDPVISEDKTELKSYNVNFLEPGDSISYSFQVANNGTINAKLSEIIKDNVSCEGYGSDEQAAKDATNVCANLEYSLKYKNEEEHFDDSGSSKTFSNDIEVNDILNSGDVKNMILTLKYKSPVDGATIEEPKDDVSISGLGIKLTYSQVKTPTGESSNPDTPVISTSFAEDSWKTIANNVKEGNTSNYHVGDTKEISLKNYGTHTVRIANMSTPDECDTENFSQTACGFVVEFADIITEAKLNNYYTNAGGWASSSISKSLNDESDSTSFFNALPSDLKGLIEETTVISGHGSTSGESNFITTNKLYLLSTKEVWENGTTSNAISSSGETGRDATRQLDYYKEKGVSTTTFTDAIKKLNGTASLWWLRSAMGTNDFQYYAVNAEGDWNGSSATIANGISPAFRFAYNPTEATSQFAEDSWETIAKNVKEGNTDKYNVGDTKKITTSKFGTQTLRLVNKSTPDECKQANFSQTACGFVIEFANILENKKYNDIKNYGIRWSGSTLSDYLNNEFYFSLPSDLKKYIATTDLVDYSYRATDQGSHYRSRVYIASQVEKIVFDFDDNASLFYDDYGYTRSLDYYYQKNQEGTLADAVNKRFNGAEKAPYWTRAQSLGAFTEVYSSDLKTTSTDMNTENGIIPMFRITGDENTDTTSKIKTFGNDSWENIAANVKAGKTSDYNVGDTKTVTFTDGTQVLAKIVNMSTPKKCSETDFSQTACGFVVEFDEILYQSTMNDTNTYEGGWPSAKLREKLNSDTFSKLPSDLQAVIADTKTVSYKDRDTNEKYTSTDKLYLASNIEYISSAIASLDEETYLKMDDYGLTRQLDYYTTALNGRFVGSVMQRNYNKTSDVKYWTRTIKKDSGFNTVGKNGSSDTNPSYGVIPYFRLEGTAASGKPTEPKSFAEDSWETIAENVKEGNTSNYHVGDTKKLNINGAGQYTVKIVNMSTPSECKKSNFSQTACGFVVEISDILGVIAMNNSDTVEGGWPASELRGTLNNELLALLPTALVEAVTNTNVVSQKNKTTGSVYTSVDKFYLPSAFEYMSSSGIASSTLKSFDDYGYTRQLDYYKSATDAGTIDEVLKRSHNGNSDVPYWTRSIVNDASFYYFGNTTLTVNATSELGYVILFRLEGPASSDEPSGSKSFAEDSWETIANNVKEGNTSNYHVGDTKKITLSDIEGNFTVRIANMSTPDECKNTNFSQSACGFVMEIPELIGELAMNNSDTVEGGWPASLMKTMLNSESFLNMLPSDLKNQLTTTKVVSYKDRTNSEYYTSNDKVYLASTFEYMSSSGLDDTILKSFDDYGVTRQLDYYKEVTKNGTFDSEMNRTYNGVANSPYWVRSIFNSSKFYNVGTDATDNTSHLSISPLFRFEGPSSSDEVSDPVSFADDTWATIANAVKTGNTDKYNVGDTKEIKTSKYGVQTLRLVNKSTPNECNGDNFSQTACGFVVEFDNILENRAMNSTTDLTGGWQSMSLRTYLNNDFLNSLPEDLRKVIGITKTVTYNDRLKKTYYKSNDKVYIKAYGEIEEIKPENLSSNDNYSEDNTVTRPLDHYTNLINAGEIQESIKKKYNDAETVYWLRTISESKELMAIGSEAKISNGTDEYGVVPMFRITGEEENEPTVETKSFAEDSWDTIYKAVKAGETDNYYIGDTKQVQLATLGTQTVKLVNKATPDECKNTNFSQTACGFVVEFVDIVANKPMNLTDTVAGGWAATNIRTYLNNEFLSELPEDLKNAIGTTKTLSNKNITSKDKVYIKSYVEIVSTTDFDGDAQSIVDDYGVTRQLDYYKAVMANGTDSLSAEITKSFNGVEDAPYWLRTIYTQESSTIFYPLGNGSDLTGMNSEAGVIPMFRITGGDEQDDTETGSFAEDSWETIANNVKKGKTSNYHVGDTKKITINGAGEYNVRIVNMSTPSECKQSDFSQTACGFVLEIPDIFTNIAMNSTDTVSGGWPGTSLRSELNAGMPQLLPAELASVVTDTKVVSYNDRSAGSLYTSTDKYYLPSAFEYYPTTESSEDLLFDDYGKTRQLDYYKALSDAGTIDEGLKRSYNGNNDAPYWTRSIVNNTSFHYFGSNPSGTNATSKLGLVTLFRLAGPDDSTEVSSSFADDSWATIAENVKTGNTSNYHVGDVKGVTIPSTGATIDAKIVNMSTPDECKKSNFSQTACGFVVEFPDIDGLGMIGMNQTDTIEGGWPSTYLRNILNNLIPSELPSELVNVVANTKTLSYKDKSTNEYYTSNDKFYTASVFEYMSSDGLEESTLNAFDDYGLTRQLDYYKSATDTGTIESVLARKKGSLTDAPYWTRSIYNSTNFYYLGNSSTDVNNSTDLSYVIFFRLEGPDDSTEVSSNFANDSWETIVNNV